MLYVTCARDGRAQRVACERAGAPVGAPPDLLGATAHHVGTSQLLCRLQLPLCTPKYRKIVSVERGLAIHSQLAPDRVGSVGSTLTIHSQLAADRALGPELCREQAGYEHFWQYTSLLNSKYV